MAGISTQKLAVAALINALDNVRVSTQLPDNKNRPKKFVVLSRIGGGSDDWATRDPRFLVECYATSELEAEQLADEVWDVWSSLRGPAPIHWGYADNNLTRYDNPDLVHHRFQFTGGLKLRR